MNTTHIETTPGVGYTVHCVRGSDPLTVRSYNADGTKRLDYLVAAEESAYIPNAYTLMTLSSEGDAAWHITPLNRVDGGVAGSGDAELPVGGNGLLSFIYKTDATPAYNPSGMIISALDDGALFATFLKALNAGDPGNFYDGDNQKFAEAVLVIGLAEPGANMLSYAQAVGGNWEAVRLG